MRSRFVLAAVCLLASWSSLGCMVFECVSDATKQTWRMMKPKPNDWDPSEEKDEDWDFVGEETRQHHGRERDPDRWFKKYIQSEKANSIERNLGID